MRHLRAPYLAALAVLVLADAADARGLTIRQQGAPEVTITVPAGWTARERRTATVLSRPGRTRILVRQCTLERSDRDMTGRGAVRRQGGDAVNVPIRGGACLRLVGGDLRFAKRLRPVLGRGGPAPASDAGAERLARAARAATLAQPRMTGTASARPFGFDRFVDSAFEYDGPYSRQLQTYRWGETVELVRDGDGDHVRRGAEPCWGATSTATDDDALEPRLELQEWDAPPSTATAWHVSYAPAEPLPDGSTRVRWTGFVADGQAIVGADGLLRRVRIDDHHMARGRSSWRTVDIAFSGFPAVIPRVTAQPSC